MSGSSGATTSAGDEPTSLLALLQFAHDLRVIKYILVVSICMQLYQYLTNLTSEIELIWYSPWKMGKVLYLLIRYTSMVFSACVLMFWFGVGFPQHRCFDIMAIITWLGPLLFPPIQFLLVLRTAAIWGYQSSTIYHLPLSLLLMDVSALVLNHSTAKSFRVAAHWRVFPGIHETYGCPSIVMFYPDRNLLLCVIGALVFDTVIMALTAISFSGKNGTHRSRFLSIFYRDGMIYFIFMSACCIANMILYFQPQERYVLRQWAIPLFSILPSLACQMILNTKREVSKSDQSTTDEEGGPIIFARRTLLSATP